MATFDPAQTPPASDAAPATTGIQSTPDVPLAPTIALPPLPKKPAMSVEAFARIRRRFDVVLVALVLAFAFLIASFPATNANFFRQLAVGRLVAHGEYPFGVDPFVYTGDGVYAINHSWLFGLLVYLLYQIPSFGGIAVVVCKALLVAALAEILLRVSRRAGQSLWIPAVCTALAILSLSPRLYLQPMCLSFLFLGLTLWLLTATRQQRADSGSRVAGRAKRLRWLIPPLFALWVNCDEWFFLGPLVVALYLVGEALQHWHPLTDDEEPDEPQRRELIELGSVLAVGLAACLLNPHHVHVFTSLPVSLGLSAAADLIQRDPQFRVLLASPLRGYYYDRQIGLSVAGLAFAPLMLLGVVSFLFAFGRSPWWRLLVWLGFALLGLYSAAALPFFAIVAGPIAALNWLDYSAHRLGTTPILTPAWRRWSLGGRASTILLGLALLGATVPGWLQAQPYEIHRVGWGVRVDPSLEQMAQQIETWRNEGKLPADPHWFNTRLEIGSYLAWFAPGERVFVDRSLPRFRETASAYLAIREGLEHDPIFNFNSGIEEGSAVESNSSSKKNWRAIFRKRGVRFWILDFGSAQTADMKAQSILFGNPDEWSLCYLRGRIAIFAWKDSSAQKPPSGVPPLNLTRVAFGPEAEQAPPRGPDTSAPPSAWWEAWSRSKPTTLDRETARLHEVRFQTLRPRMNHDNSRVWQGVVALAAIGQSLPRGPIPNSLLPLSWGCTYEDLFPSGARGPTRQPRPQELDAFRARALFLGDLDVGPPDSLYLAIRAARRGLFVNPQDANAYFLLGQAYSLLEAETHERTLKGVSPQLETVATQMVEIRRTQMVTAYQNCLRLLPKRMNASERMTAAEAHESLVNAFNRLEYQESTVHHLRELLKLMTAIGPLPGEKAADRARKLDALTKELTKRDDRLERALNEYEVHSANKPLREKVRVALEKGLPETALKAVDRAGSEEVSDLKDPALVGRMIGLLLDLGQLDKARELLLPEAEMIGQPVSPNHLAFHVRLSAAQGDYADMDRHLSEGLNHAWKDPSGRSPPEAGPLIAARLGFVLLAQAKRATDVPRLPSLIQEVPSEFQVRRWRLEAVSSGVSESQQRADLYVMRGWLALEAGRCLEASRFFRTALDTIVPAERWHPEMRMDTLLDPREIQILQQLTARQNTSLRLSQYYLKWLDDSAR